MNLLIVDDEGIAVEGIIDGVDWSRLPVEQIYTANSLAQAVDIMLSRNVDILLCDIEMPGGNGLDLIEWTREHLPGVICIILSCHGEFDFARQAVRLGCMDYVLKPVDPGVLAGYLLKAAHLKQERAAEEQYRDLGKTYVRSISDAAEQAERTVADTVERVKRHIAENIENKLTVGELAKRFNFSPDYFARAFKRETGKSINEYITECRVRLAARLLHDTDLPLGIISQRVGFDNPSYFIKRFRERYSMAPKEYRAQVTGR